jgi:hypothetical protein
VAQHLADPGRDGAVEVHEVVRGQVVGHRLEAVQLVRVRGLERVGDQVAVRQQDALRVAGRTAGEVDVRRRVRVHGHRGWRRVGRQQVVQRDHPGRRQDFLVDQYHVPQVGQLVADLRHLRQHRLRAAQHGGAAEMQDPAQPGAAQHRVDRDRGTPGPQRAVEEHRERGSEQRGDRHPAVAGQSAKGRRTPVDPLVQLGQAHVVGGGTDGRPVGDPRRRAPQQLVQPGRVVQPRLGRRCVGGGDRLWHGRSSFHAAGTAVIEVTA